MNKRTKIFFIIFLAVALLVIVLFFYLRGYAPKYRWEPNYSHKNDQPYGLRLFYEMLTETHTGDNFVYVNRTPKLFITNNDTASLYIFVGEKFVIDSLSSIAFINFVKRGNNVFISSITSHHIIFKELTENQHPTIYNNYYYDSIVNQSFVSDTSKVYQFDHRVGKKLVSQSWYGFDSSVIIDSLSLYGFESISMIDDGLVDCFRIKCGKGWFIFHNNPIMLTNYYLAKDKGRQYLNDLFADYQKPRIYWDEYSTSALSDNISGRESPLKFILSQRSLRWSWYLLCIFSIIFVIFNSKRKQAHIPLLPANRNTTVEYVTALATLHHQNNSLLFLADEILKQFLSFVKVKYGISSNIDKKDLPRILAPVSGISENELDKLFKHYIGIKYNPAPEPKHIIALYTSIEYFYKNCK